MAFKDALELVLQLEGRTYTNHPLDAGGPTMWGITQDTYNNYCSLRGLPYKPVGKLTEEEITTIYEACFWNLPQSSEGTPICTLLTAPADTVFFQLSVNLGPSRATKLLQAAINTEPDGSFGPRSLADLQNTKDVPLVLLTAQLAHYATVAQDWDRQGLYNRTVKVREWINALQKPGDTKIKAKGI